MVGAHTFIIHHSSFTCPVRPYQGNHICLLLFGSGGGKMNRKKEVRL